MLRVGWRKNAHFNVPGLQLHCDIRSRHVLPAVTRILLDLMVFSEISKKTRNIYVVISQHYGVNSQHYGVIPRNRFFNMFCLGMGEVFWLNFSPHEYFHIGQGGGDTQIGNHELREWPFVPRNAQREETPRSAWVYSESFSCFHHG